MFFFHQKGANVEFLDIFFQNSEDFIHISWELENVYKIRGGLSFTRYLPQQLKLLPNRYCLRVIRFKFPLNYNMLSFLAKKQSPTIFN